MKSALKWCVVPLLATSLLAQTATPKKKVAAKAAQPAVTIEDIQSLRDALAAQQQQIQQLKQQLQDKDAAWQQSQQQLQQAQSTASDAQQKAASAESAAVEQKDTVSKLSSDLADVQTTLTNNALSSQDEQKRMSSLEGIVGRFRFSGDVRVRDDSAFQKGTADRNRPRIRVRLGIDGKLGEDFVGGLAIATGTLLDPTSSNETLTSYFERKTIGLDRGYITYNPVAHKWLSLTGGKFAYQWQRTSVTGDSDITPEGFNEKFSFDLHSKNFKNFTAQLIQLTVNEVPGGTDAYALGGQVSAKMQFGPWSTTPSFLILNWNNPNQLLTTPTSSIAACQAPNSTPVGTCGFGPNGITNATYTDGSGKAAFWSGYEYADFIINNQIKTPWSRLPVNLIGEFLRNLKAAGHPLDSTGAIATNLSSQSDEYGFDLSLGQTKNKNDVQFGYAWLRQEQDSVLASFAESDQRAPTNVLQHRIYGMWKVRANTVASVTYWRGRTLNSYLQNSRRGAGVAVGQVEPYYNRFQFDLVYSF